MHKAWKKFHNTVYWVDIKIDLKKELMFFQALWNAIVLQGILPTYCIPKAIKMETGQNKNEKVHASPRLRPKISFKHNWMKDSSSDVDQRPAGQVFQ